MENIQEICSKLYKELYGKEPPAGVVFTASSIDYLKRQIALAEEADLRDRYEH